MFLKSAVAAVAGSAFLPLSCTPRRRQVVRFGIVTDCHYADADTLKTRFYRESLDKLTECVALMNDEKVDFLIELGDFIDKDRPPVESKTLEYLQNIEAVFQQFNGPTYHVLGNHDMDSISKQQFLMRVENTDIDASHSYYSFDFKELHFIVLDANYKADGTSYDHGNFEWRDTNIPAHELDWLRQDLTVTRGPIIVFIHQLLDEADSFSVNNVAEVRHIIEESGRVLAVFQGHYHKGKYKNINGIHYYTLTAMVEGSGEENNSYAIVEVQPDLSIIVNGYRKAMSRRMSRYAAHVDIAKK